MTRVFRILGTGMLALAVMTGLALSLIYLASEPQLRREAEEKLGKKFDVRAFNDALLADGAMPIDILELRMREWISRQTN